MNSSIYAGLRWLLISPIQHPSGGVCLDYRSPEAELGSITTEATAWYIQGLVGIGEADPQRISRAEKAGRFLMESAFDLSSDLFLTRPVANDSTEAKSAELLSCAAAIRALVSLFRATSDAAYLECAARCSRAMRSRMARVDGSFFPRFDVTLATPVYELEPGLEQLKVAAALIELSEVVADREHAAPVEQMTSWALRNQQLAFAWAADPSEAQRCYALFLEGLLPAASADFMSAQTLQAGLTRLEQALDETPAGSRSPAVLARLLRLRLFADGLGIVELDRTRAEEEAARLRAYQIQSPDPKIDGAFGLQPKDELEAVVDPESAIVALQSLTIWEESSDGGCRRGWQHLI